MLLTNGPARRLRTVLVAVVSTASVGMTLAFGPVVDAPHPAVAPGLGASTVGSDGDPIVANSAVVRAAGLAEVEPALPRPARTPQRPAFARVGDVELVAPSPDIHLVGFHESAGGTATLEPIEDVEPMMTLASRGRGTHPRSAVDISMPVGVEVAAVVTGTVTAVDAYTLYGRTTDVIVEIAPAEAPTMRVKMLHIAEIAVEVGDEVRAGETVVAGTARLLGFGSQIDRHTGARTPHLHVEVVR